MSEQDIPICVYTSSVRAPMNWGVALRSSARRASSTNWPIEYQRADLRRYKAAVISKSQHSKERLSCTHLLSLGSFAIDGGHDDI